MRLENDTDVSPYYLRADTAHRQAREKRQSGDLTESDRVGDPLRRQAQSGRQQSDFVGHLQRDTAGKRCPINDLPDTVAGGA